MLTDFPNYCAVLGSKLDILEELFKNGAKVTDPHNDQYLLIKKAIGLHNNQIFPLIYSKCDPNFPQGQNTYAMRAAISHNLFALKTVYRGLEDITYHFYDRSGYNSLISLISTNDTSKILKEPFLQILDDAKDISIEPPEEPGKPCEGVCHWACSYRDIDVAKAMFKTKNVQINRFDNSFKTGAFRLAEDRGPATVEMLKLLIEMGFDVNARYSDEYPTLLEQFVSSLTRNYAAIELLIKYGADINALHSKQTDVYKNKMTLLQFVKERRRDSKMKKIFLQAEEENY